MTIVWCLISLWLGTVVGYAAWRCRPVVVVLSDAPTEGKFGGIAFRCLMVIARGLDDKRTTAWGHKRAWNRLPDRMWQRGNRIREGWTVHHFREEIDVIHENILGNDPNGKFEAAAERLLARLNAERIGGFVKMPDVRCEYYANYEDPSTSLVIRLARGYDMRENTFLTFLDVAAEVADKC